MVYWLEKEIGQFFYGIGSLSYLAPKIWKLIPQSLKDETKLNSKLKSKHGLPVNANASYVKSIVVILVSFKLFLCIDFTTLLMPVFYIFYENILTCYCKILIISITLFVLV